MDLFKKLSPEEKQKKLDQKYMKLAIREAEKAAKHHEVPIGCVITHENKLISKGHNCRNTMKSALAHAEILAISDACKKLKDWRLENCTLYVTLEPCQMCTGAIVQARVPRVVIGCMNPKAGCAGSIINLLQMDKFTHQSEITYGVLEEECSVMLKKFFKDLRDYRKNYPSNYRASHPRMENISKKKLMPKESDFKDSDFYEKESCD